jgi:hypothetical protein
MLWVFFSAAGTGRLFKIGGKRICREEWEKLSKYRCAKLLASYPNRLKSVIAVKGASTKY